MANGYRKLAYVVEVADVSPVEGSDFLDLVKFLGWQAVVSRDSFKVGDKGVFFEADTEISAPLGRVIAPNNKLIKDGIKVKVSRIRGALSHGLLLPVEDFYEAFSKDFIDYNADDLTELFGLEQPRSEEVYVDGEKVIRVFHPVISKTDEIRGQSNPRYLEALHGKPYYITEKIDGTSRTIVFEDGEFSVYTRRTLVAENESALVYKILEESGVIDSIKKAGEDVYLQGELYGEKIQGNRLKIKGNRFAVFNIGNPKTGAYYSRTDWEEVLKRIDPDGKIELVKTIDTGDSFNYDFKELSAIANEFYEGTNYVREGIVIRPLHEDTLSGEKFGERLSFKILSEEYEMKSSKNTRRNKARGRK